MAVTRKPTSAVGFIGLQATNTIGYKRSARWHAMTRDPGRWPYVHSLTMTASPVAISLPRLLAHHDTGPDNTSTDVLARKRLPTAPEGRVEHGCLSGKQVTLNLSLSLNLSYFVAR